MKFKFIDKIGLEIEGGWVNGRSDLTQDGSLRYDEFTAVSYRDDYDARTKIGELISPRPHATLEEAVNFLNKNWPDDMTARCGFHIHFSLKNIRYYGQLMNKDFFDFFMGKMREWATDYCCSNPQFWDRIENNNRYSRTSFSPEKQIKATAKGDHRYTHLNYCFAMHKTIECRLFPTFESAETAISALTALVNCVEGWLESNPCAIDDTSEALDFTNEQGNEPIEESLEMSLDENELPLSLKPFNFFLDNPAEKKPTKFFETESSPIVKPKRPYVRRKNPYQNPYSKYYYGKPPTNIIVDEPGF